MTELYGDENLAEVLEEVIDHTEGLIDRYDDEEWRNPPREINLMNLRFQYIVYNNIRSLRNQNVIHINSSKKLISLDHIPSEYKHEIRYSNSPIPRITEQYIKTWLNNLFMYGDEINIFLEDKGNGQFKIVKGYMDYLIIGNPPFFINDDDFFKKDEVSYKKYLTESEKVYLNKNICLIPFKIGNQCYYIVCSNLSDSLVLYEDKSFFTQINQQSNLYDIIQIHSMIIPNEDLVFKKFITESLQKALKTNTKLFKKFTLHIQKHLTEKDFMNKYNEIKK